MPANGVYACWAQEGGRSARIPAVANVGRRPTFGGGALGLEVHLLDWNGDLYGCRLRVAFASRLRGERAFPSAEALVEQIHRRARAAYGDAAGEMSAIRLYEDLARLQLRAGGTAITDG